MITMKDVAALERGADMIEAEIAKDPPEPGDEAGQLLALVAPAVLRVLAALARERMEKPPGGFAS